MKKMNAFIFICCYLFMTKIVFASEVEIEGKTYQCNRISYQKHLCKYGSKQAYVVNSENNSYVAITKESNGLLAIKGVKKVINERIIEYQATTPPPVYEDSVYNRMLVADIVDKVFNKENNEPFANEIKADALKVIASGRDLKKDVKIYIDDLGENFQCTNGVTRPYTAQETKYQKQYNAKFVCPFYSCVGSNPSQKVLMMLPKPGSTYTQPTAMLLQHGSGRLFEGGFKVTDNSSLPVSIIPKKVVEVPEIVHPDDIDPDLMIPSVFGKNTDTYKYLMSIAKKDTEVLELADLCSTDKDLAPLFEEQKKVAELVQKMTSEAELVEYLKMVNEKIISFYVDRKKGEKLGCYYQDKIVDTGVMEKFDRLKEISTIQGVTKYLKPDEIQDLFKKAKAMKDIPFAYKEDGCYARAHLMARRFEKMGIPTQKAWIKGKLSVEGMDSEWDYHVAPMIKVKEKDGRIVNYVIDPSVNDKAVPMDVWVASIKTKTKGPIMKTTYPFPVNGLDFDRTVVAISNSDAYGPIETPNMTEENKMEFSISRLKQYSNALAEAK